MELKADTDQTFFRALEEDYTDIFFETLASRGSVDTEHSFLASVMGCLNEDSMILTKQGWKKVVDIAVGDFVLSVNKKYKREWKRVKNKFKYHFNKKVNELVLENGVKLNATKNHRFFVDGKYVSVKDLVVGDKLQFVAESKYGCSSNISEGVAELLGMILADGHLENRSFVRKCKNRNSYVVNVMRLRFYKSEKSILDRFKLLFKNEFGLSLNSYDDKNTKGTKVLYIQNKKIIDKLNKLGVPYGRKSSIISVPSCIFEGNDKIRLAFLRGAFSCDGSVYGSNIEYSTVSKKFADGIRLLLFNFGIKNKLHHFSRFGEKVNDVFRLKISEYDSEKIFFDKIGFSSCKKFNRLKELLKKNRNYELLDREKEHYTNFSRIISIGAGIFCDYVYDIEVEDNNNYVVNGVLSHNSQGSGKSYSAIACCAALDPKFSVNNIYFDYNDLIYNRDKLKPHTAVLVDEQSESYGVDSHRVNIILTALKEQLRKKSIHFFFCSPTLKDEYKSSQYVLETMYIDREEGVVYAAYKTRDLLTLGYVRIPHPLNFVSKKFLADYEAKKDEHLDKLTGVKQVDEIEQRVNKILETTLFKKANLVYKKKLGYIPMGMLFQIINKLYPEFKSSVIVGELASRIKLNLELSGEWSVSGSKRKKQ